MPKKTKSNVFVSDLGQELRKVTWPERNTVIKATLLVLSIFIFTTVYVSGADIVFTRIFLALKQG